MKKGKAVRVYSINRQKLTEALEALDELIKPIKDSLDKKGQDERTN